jgi:elongation of very long chain fatty acids protein 6
MDSYLFDFERNFDGSSYLQFYKNQYWLGVVIPLIYIYLVKSAHVKTKSQLRSLTIFWNLTLSIFSVWGFIRICNFVIERMRRDGFYGIACTVTDEEASSGPLGLWIMLFTFSKIPELFDTVLLVLKGKSVEFLHWFHHATVLWYSWDAYSSQSSMGIYFALMNFYVHFIMYFYFYLTACGYKPVWAKLVTLLQISQMFAGAGVCLMVLYYKLSDYECRVGNANLVGGLAIYASYLILFVKFAQKRYAPRKRE